MPSTNGLQYRMESSRAWQKVWNQLHVSLDNIWNSEGITLAKARQNEFTEVSRREVAKAPHRTTYCYCKYAPAPMDFHPGELFKILQEDLFVHPLIVRMNTRSRQASVLMALEIFKFLRKEIEDNHFQYTIDWWSRSLSDVGRSFLIIGFRHCDLREMI